MPSPAWENLDDFLSVDDFGVEVTLETQAGETRVFVGIFDEPYLNAQLGEFDMDSSKPRVLAKETDLAGVDRGDRATIDGRAFDIMTGAQSTGDGMAVLELTEA